MRPQYHVYARRSPVSETALAVRVSKSWWGGPGVGGVARQVLEVELEVTEGSETETLYQLLLDLAEALQVASESRT